MHKSWSASKPIRVRLHIPSMSQFLIPSKNGSNAFLWNCLHITLKDAAHKNSDLDGICKRGLSEWKIKIVCGFGLLLSADEVWGKVNVFRSVVCPRGGGLCMMSLPVQAGLCPGVSVWGGSLSLGGAFLSKGGTSHLHGQRPPPRVQ